MNKSRPASIYIMTMLMTTAIGYASTRGYVNVSDAIMEPREKPVVLESYERVAGEINMQTLEIVGL